MSTKDIKLQILPAHRVQPLLIDGETRPVRKTRIFDGHGREFEGLEDVTSAEDPRQPFSVLVTITMRLRSDEIVIIDSPPDHA